MVAGDGDARQHAALVDADTEGLVLTSKNRYKDGQGFTHAVPDVVTVLEPKNAMSDFATPENPFILPCSGGLLDVTVDDILEGQRRSGARIAMTPTGYVRAGEPDTLRAVATAGNAFTRDDILHHIFLAPSYLHPDNLRQTTAILRKCELPIALTVASKQDPMRHTGVVDGLRHLFSTLDWAMLWRGDLAVMDALAHGAKSASVGTLPSTRHGVPAGDRGQSSPDDRSPSVLVPELARYVRSGKLRNWFAGTAPVCWCQVCHGRPLDRFEDSPSDHASAMRHNLLAARAVRQDLLAAPVFRSAWYEFVDNAIVAHAKLRATTSVNVETPPVLKKWATRHALPVTAASTVSSKNQDVAE